MKVVLIRPRHRSHLITPPLGLAYIQASIKARGDECRVIDGQLEGWGTERMVEEVQEEWSDCVGVNAMSAYWRESRELGDAVVATGRYVVFGGPHVSVTMSGAPLRNMPGMGRTSFWSGEGEEWTGTYGRPAAKAESLDDLPFPDWTGIEPARYPPAPHGGVAKAFPTAPIITTRGCPYRCTFCASPKLWGSKVRFRSARNVVDEIEQLQRRWGAREVHVEDDNFTLRREHAARVAEELLRRGVRMPWALPNGIRADKVDPALLRLLRRAGCYSVAFGIESADPAILAACGKHETIEQIEQAIAWAKEAGLLTQGFFIFGLPGETPETIERTIRWACRSKLDKAQFLLLDVLPGSQLWDEGKRAKADYQSYHEPSWVPETVPVDVLRSAPRRAFLRFFASRPSRALRLASMVRPRQLGWVARRMLDCL